MKFIPSENPAEEDNVNVTKVSPLNDMLIMLVGALAILIILYALLGFFAEQIARRLPVEVEEKLGSVFKDAFDDENVSESEKRIQQLINELKPAGEKRSFKVVVVKEDQVNALAIPGGTIVIFSKLIEQTKSENELAFILGHELGHFANRDHLRGLGRSLVLMTISIVLFGSNNPASTFLSNSVTKVEMKFSQNQEIRADMYALNTVNKKYGHVGGATDFFEKIAKNDKSDWFSAYFASHPHPGKRIGIIKDESEKIGFQFKEVKPLDKSFMQF